MILALAPGGGEPLVLEIDRRRVSAKNPHQLFVIMILTGVLMTAVAFVFLRNQVRPIRRLAQVAEAFGKGRVDPYTPSGALEVRAAGRAFLDMRNRIERHIEQRTMMLSGVSHDLRTPLTRIKLGLSMLDPAPETEDLLRDVAEMEALLDTFLDFARSEAFDDPEEVDVLALPALPGRRPRMPAVWAARSCWTCPRRRRSWRCAPVPCGGACPTC